MPTYTNDLLVESVTVGMWISDGRDELRVTPNLVTDVSWQEGRILVGFADGWTRVLPYGCKVMEFQDI